MKNILLLLHLWKWQQFLLVSNIFFLKVTTVECDLQKWAVVFCWGFFPFSLLVGRKESKCREFFIAAFEYGLFEQPACRVC